MVDNKAVAGPKGFGKWGRALLAKAGFGRREAELRLDAALHEAAAGNRAQEVQELLKRGANPRWKNPKTGLDALGDAVANHALDSTRALIEAGMGVGSPCMGEGASALWFACGHGGAEMAKLLVELGADGDLIFTVTGTSPLMEAAWRSHPDSVNAIISACNPRTSSPTGLSALFFAACSGQGFDEERMQVARTLLPFGGLLHEISSKDEDKRTALERAAELQDSQTFSVYLEHLTCEQGLAWSEKLIALTSDDPDKVKALEPFLARWEEFNALKAAAPDPVSPKKRHGI